MEQGRHLDLHFAHGGQHVLIFRPAFGALDRLRDDESAVPGLLLLQVFSFERGHVHKEALQIAVEFRAAGLANELGVKSFELPFSSVG